MKAMKANERTQGNQGTLTNANEAIAWKSIARKAREARRARIKQQ
jgi:hypothetical protein